MVVREVFYFARDVFFISPRVIQGPSADRHMIGNCLNCIMRFIGGPPPKKICGLKTCKIMVDFIQPPTLFANISGTAQDIWNRKANFSRSISNAFYEKGSVNFGPQITEIFEFGPTKMHALFWDTIFQPLGGAAPWNFLHALQIDQALLAHTRTGRGSPKKF